MSTALDQIAQPRAVVGTSQATAVEQARAVAEVAAALRGAQDNPRNEDAARAAMLRACSTFALAERAFYSVPNRGQGPSVHLARELARCWGNTQHGMVELKRDDAGGESEMQAFAWDVEGNTRSVRSFISPHVRMKGKQRQALTDVNDIVNQNNNTASRAVREVIFTVLPVWFREEAIAACRATLERGDGDSLTTRITKAVDTFRRLDVTAEQLEKRLRRPRSQWDAQDVADLLVVFGSLKSGDSTVAEEFPSDDAPAPTGRVTAADIAPKAGATAAVVEELPVDPADDHASVIAAENAGEQA